MKRRTFLKMAGGTGLSFPILNNFPFERSAMANQENNMFYNKEKLANRNQNRSTVVCQNGIVCTAQPLASQAGIDILKSGGNAIDAAICANTMLSVVEPMMCGPGGDLFAIVWIEKEKKLYGLNASGRSPYNWSLDRIKEMGLAEIPTFGPLSWSVPGCVSGWDKLSQKFGTKKTAELLQSAIRYAENGFPVSPIIANSWRSANNEKYETLANTFAPNGKTPQFGDIFKTRILQIFIKY